MYTVIWNENDDNTGHSWEQSHEFDSVVDAAEYILILNHRPWVTDIRVERT